MKDLPSKFQFRHKRDTGFTHTCKINARGDYEVTWARGWANVIGEVPWRVFQKLEVEYAVNACDWMVVEDKPKQEEELPDEFYFLNSLGEPFKAQRLQHYWQLTCQEDGRTVSVSEDQVKTSLKISWKILDKRPLTAEQQKAVNAFREQIQQLDSSIRINEQTIEHHQRMIGNYEQRQNDLLEKIAEITGEDSPSVVKAKEMKAELAKLKKGNV